MDPAFLAATLAPFRSDPADSAVLLDIDGTLAPIVEHAQDATVPEATRQLLMTLARRFGLVACISGRRASDARALVAIGSINYLGSHGAEVLGAGATEAVLDPRLHAWADRVQAFCRELDTIELHRRRVRVEDKGSILALHWRGAADEQAAKQAIDELAALATARGFEVHWGRKVMEIWPPVPVNKGTGILALMRGRGLHNALFAGDDVTDLDGFRALRTLAAEAELRNALCIGVASDEGPPEIVSQADLVVAGTDGVRAILATLAGGEGED